MNNCPHFTLTQDAERPVYVCVVCHQDIASSTAVNMRGNSELSDSQVATVRENLPRPIQIRFEVFHAAHPEVYNKLVGMARELKAAGHRHYGICTLYEQLRWHFRVRIADKTSPFKLSDNYRSRYARRIMEQEPDLQGFFKTRSLRRM